MGYVSDNPFLRIVLGLEIGENFKK